MLSCIKRCPLGGGGGGNHHIHVCRQPAAQSVRCNPSTAASLGVLVRDKAVAPAPAWGSWASARLLLLQQRARMGSSQEGKRWFQQVVWNSLPPKAFLGRPLAREVKLQVALPLRAPVPWINCARAIGTCSNPIVPSCSRTVQCLRWCPEWGWAHSQKNDLRSHSMWS